MQYTENYQIHIAKRGADTVAEDLFDMSEEEAVAEWHRVTKMQGPGSLVTLVRVMTVTVASSSK